MIKLSKGETRGLAKLLERTPDHGFEGLLIERRLPQCDVLVTITRKVPVPGRRIWGVREDRTVIGPRGGHYYS